MGVLEMVGQEMAPHGDDKNALFIQGQLRDLSTNSVFNFTVKCMDHWAVVTADDKNFLKKMVKAEQRKGNEYIKYLPSKRWVIEHYPNMLKAQIAKKISKSLKAGGANITKNGN